MDVTICIGSSCHLRGSRDVVQILEKLIANYRLQDQVELKGSFCMGQCTSGVCVTINDEVYHITPADTEEFFQNHILGALQP